MKLTYFLVLVAVAIAVLEIQVMLLHDQLAKLNPNVKYDFTNGVCEAGGKTWPARPGPMCFTMDMPK